MRARRLMVCGLLIFSVVTAVSLPYQAEAVPFTLTLEDPVHSVVVSITDGGALDSNPAAGVITFIGAVGNWNLNVSTGLSQPVVGDPPHYAQMDLNTLSLSQGAGTLVLTLVDDWSELNGQADFGLTLTNAIGGTFQGTAEAAGSLTQEDGTEWTIANATLGPGADSDTASILVPAVGGGFELKEVVRIVHTDTGTTSFDKELTAAPVPEPATMLLLGSGLLCVAAVGKGLGKKKKTRKA